MSGQNEQNLQAFIQNIENLLINQRQDEAILELQRMNGELWEANKYNVYLDLIQKFPNCWFGYLKLIEFQYEYQFHENELFNIYNYDKEKRIKNQIIEISNLFEKMKINAPIYELQKYYYYMGMLYYKMYQYEMAMEYFLNFYSKQQHENLKQNKELIDKYCEIIQHIVILHKKQNNNKEAVVFIEEGLKFDHQKTFLHYQLAKIQSEVDNNYEKSLENYNIVVQNMKNEYQNSLQWSNKYNDSIQPDVLYEKIVFCMEKIGNQKQQIIQVLEKAKGQKWIDDNYQYQNKIKDWLIKLLFLSKQNIFSEKLILRKQYMEQEHIQVLEKIFQNMGFFNNYKDHYSFNLKIGLFYQKFGMFQKALHSFYIYYSINHQNDNIEQYMLECVIAYYLQQPKEKYNNFFDFFDKRIDQSLQPIYYQVIIKNRKLLHKFEVTELQNYNLEQYFDRYHQKFEKNEWNIEQHKFQYEQFLYETRIYLEKKIKILEDKLNSCDDEKIPEEEGFNYYQLLEKIKKEIYQLRLIFNRQQQQIDYFEFQKQIYEQDEEEEKFFLPLQKILEKYNQDPQQTFNLVNDVLNNFKFSLLQIDQGEYYMEQISKFHQKQVYLKCCQEMTKSQMLLTWQGIRETIPKDQKNGFRLEIRQEILQFLFIKN